MMNDLMKALELPTGADGLDLLGAVAVVLADPKGSAKTIREYRKARDEAKAMVALVGPANEIVALRATAETDAAEAAAAKRAAQEARDRAQGEATEARRTIIVKAGKERDDIVAASRTKATEIEAAATAAGERAQARETAAANLEESAGARLKKREDNVKAGEDQLALDRESFDKDRAALDEQITHFNAFAGGAKPIKSAAGRQ